MSEFKKIVLDGRVLNVHKDAKVLATSLKKQGAMNSNDHLRDRIEALQRKYGGNCGFIV